MQVHPPALVSPSTAAGVPGPSILSGAMEAATSVGLKVLASNFSSTPYSTLAPPTFISNYSETIKALLKPGTGVAAATDPPMMSSSTSLPAWQTPIALLTSAMSPVQAIPPIPSHVVYIPPHISSSLPSPSPLSSSPSLSTSPTQRPPSMPKAAKPRPVRIQSTITHAGTPSPSESSYKSRPPFSPPSPRPANDPLQTSGQLRPHCTARERLVRWRPVTTRSVTQPLTQEDIQRIYTVISFAWRDATKETYGSGLLVYHTFCNIRHIPEELRAPASKDIISAFVASLAGTYAAPTITNYINGVHNWHIVHGLPWAFVNTEASILLKAAKSLAPASSKRPPREPYTIDTIIKIREQLSLTLPLDAAVFACLTTLFFATARTGEFTVPNLNSFNSSLHITHNHVTTQRDRSGLEITNFHLPCTKSAPTGKDVNWAKQDGPSNPFEALLNHYLVNDPLGDAHLFAYKVKNSHKPSPAANSLRLSTAQPSVPDYLLSKATASALDLLSNIYSVTFPLRWLRSKGVGRVTLFSSISATTPKY
ncbi:hypothetical protein V8E55_009906 [Tylopilus felleus]